MRVSRGRGHLAAGRCPTSRVSRGRGHRPGRGRRLTWRGSRGRRWPPEAPAAIRRSNAASVHEVWACSRLREHVLAAGLFSDNSSSSDHPYHLLLSLSSTLPFATFAAIDPTTCYYRCRCFYHLLPSLPLLLPPAIITAVYTITDMMRFLRLQDNSGEGEGESWGGSHWGHCYECSNVFYSGDDDEEVARAKQHFRRESGRRWAKTTRQYREVSLSSSSSTYCCDRCCQRC